MWTSVPGSTRGLWEKMGSDRTQARALKPSYFALEALLVLWTQASWHSVIFRKNGWHKRESRRSVNLRGWVRSQHGLGKSPACQGHSQSRTGSHRALQSQRPWRQGRRNQSNRAGWADCICQPACMWHLKSWIQEGLNRVLRQFRKKRKLIGQKSILWRSTGSDPSCTTPYTITKTFLKGHSPEVFASGVITKKIFMIFSSKRNCKPLQIFPSLQENIIDDQLFKRHIIWIYSVIFASVQLSCWRLISNIINSRSYLFLFPQAIGLLMPLRGWRAELCFLLVFFTYQPVFLFAPYQTVCLGDFILRIADDEIRGGLEEGKWQAWLSNSRASLRRESADR